MGEAGEMAGQVCSASRCRPMAGVTVVLQGASGTESQRVETDGDGRWRLDGAAGAAEVVTFSKTGFITKRYHADTRPPLVRLLEEQLVGYHDTLSARPGDEVVARVHATAPFDAALVRFGAQRETVLKLGTFGPTPQQADDGHFVDRGCRWTESLRYTIPSDARPGLFGLALASGSQSFVIPLVVSTPVEHVGRPSDVLVLASDSTWLAYNIWGGRSLYRNFELFPEGNGPDPQEEGWARQAKAAIARFIPNWLLRRIVRKVVVPAWRFERLSASRPMPHCGLDQTDPRRPFTNHLAAAEWRVLAWLESVGLSYDIVSCFELDRRPQLLQGYKAVVLNSHCEYWSKPMYEGLLRFFAEDKGWIVNLGGNSIYRQVAFDDDGSMRCLQFSFPDGGHDESELLGVRLTSTDYGTAAGYRVLQPGHWVFEHTGLREGDGFGADCVLRDTPGAGAGYDPARPTPDGQLRGIGASGWETDKLTGRAPRDIAHVAKGLNPAGGADMVVRDPTAAHGGVFSASSITFGGSLLVDPVVARIVTNVLRRAGVPTGEPA